MPYFIDTNVAIGYTIIHDKWHESSKEFIENTLDYIFWSELVEIEYANKINEIIDLAEIFLEMTDYILINNQKDFINYDDFERFVLKKTKPCKLDEIKKRRILENFWLKYQFNEGISQIVSLKFNNFKEESFEKVYIKQDNRLQKIMINDDCGLDYYMKYPIYTQYLNSNGIHNPDCRIIADAHDCGVKHKNLIFVSNDGKMINRINRLEISFPTIIEFRSLN
jgi:predicted nucleic acid-binding protein